jgi:ssRNA-specific RNase YbeY (16S rRNA maturation enzyme)
MKTIRATSGPFAERPHFEPAEMDRTCVDELRKAGFYPTDPEPIRIDRFIEKRFGIAHDYESLPPGVLGYTKFSKNGVESIVISRSLAEENSDVARRRERATLAHEAGHGLLHAYLFAVETPAVSLFGAENCSGSQILCREVTDQQSAVRAKPSWSEYQANRMIGGLLLPRGLVTKALQSYLISAGQLGERTIDPARRSDAERHVSTTFDVNPIVARIRLDDMFTPEKGGQMLL